MVHKLFICPFSNFPLKKWLVFWKDIFEGHFLFLPQMYLLFFNLQYLFGLLMAPQKFVNVCEALIFLYFFLNDSFILPTSICMQIPSHPKSCCAPWISIPNYCCRLRPMMMSNYAFNFLCRTWNLALKILFEVSCGNVNFLDDCRDIKLAWSGTPFSLVVWFFLFTSNSSLIIAFVFCCWWYWRTILCQHVFD